MLQNNLYTLIYVQEQEEKTYKAQIRLDPSHAIFLGHFPSQPVLPGVCLLEMVKEILSTLKNRSLNFKSAAAIKYLKVVDPGQDPLLTFEIQVLEEGVEYLKVNATSFLQDGSVNFKLKGVFG